MNTVYPPTNIVCGGYKKYTNSQEGHGWMIEDGQLLFDRMSGPLVVMELIVCKCNRMCKGPECQWFSNALM